jgi:ribonuclease III
MSELKILENVLGYEFVDKKLMKVALTHSSASSRYNNERLEFLGDAVLDLVISEYLYKSKDGFHEGRLTKTRAAIVNEKVLFAIAKRINVSHFIKLGKGEENGGGRNKSSILADSIEALIGAIYIDSDYENTKQVVMKIFGKEIEAVLSGGGFKDYKTRLQEYFHKVPNTKIAYIVYRQKGPPHNRTFYVNFIVNGKVCASGTGKTKKEAEQVAAKKALKIAPKKFIQE